MIVATAIPGLFLIEMLTVAVLSARTLHSLKTMLPSLSLAADVVITIVATPRHTHKSAMINADISAFDLILFVIYLSPFLIFIYYTFKYTPFW